MLCCCGKCSTYQNRHGRWWIHAETRFAKCKSRRWKMYMDVHFSPCLRFISARLLASVPSLFKRLRERISERTGMSVVWISNEFRRKAKLAGKNIQGCIFLPCLRLICVCASYLYRLFPKALEGCLLHLFSKGLRKSISERTRMSVVPRSSDVFAQQKLAFKNWQGGQFLNLPRMAVVPCSSKFFARKTCRWTVYTDVHCSTAERIVGAAKPFRRNEAERRNPEKPGFCWKQKAAQN